MSDPISGQTVLGAFGNASCLGRRQLATLLGIDGDDPLLARLLGELQRQGHIVRVRGKGRQASYLLATFEGLSAAERQRRSRAAAGPAEDRPGH